jgi:hypothetical protein
MELRKLTPGEIQSVIAKIRKKYDEYSVKYFKSKTLKDSFEDRYINALEKRVDVSSFLLAEISAIEELIRREEEKAAAAKAAKPEKKPGIADRVLEEHRRRIEKYEAVPIHPGARGELCKLLGALVVLEKEHLPNLVPVLRDTAYSMASYDMINLESRLRTLADRDREGIPTYLVRYIAHLKRFPRSTAVIEREENEFIKESAFFLHDFLTILRRVKENYRDLEEDKKATLATVLDAVEEIIADFRLKDLKRS